MEACKSATGGGEGVEWLVEEDYDNTDGHMECDVPGYSPPKNKGTYTLKHYLISSKLPSWFSKLLPKEVMFLEEKAWVSDDYRFATITNGFLSKSKFSFVLESKIVNHDKGTQENLFNLTEKQRNERIVQYYDVCDRYKNEVIPPNEDITHFQSEHIKGSPMQPGWWKERDLSEVSCHYWLLHINFAYFGFQTIGESMIYTNQCYMNRQTERQMIVTIDSWYSLGKEDIRRMEEQCMKDLKEKMEHGPMSQAYAITS
ncbi:hypothetical protein WA588_000324 [Blastocystis sp. NMH]